MKSLYNFAAYFSAAVFSMIGWIGEKLTGRNFVEEFMLGGYGGWEDDEKTAIDTAEEVPTDLSMHEPASWPNWWTCVCGQEHRGKAFCWYCGKSEDTTPVGW